MECHVWALDHCSIVESFALIQLMVVKKWVIYLGIIHKRSPKNWHPGDSTNGSGPCGWGAGFVVWDSNRDAVPQNPKPPRKPGIHKGPRYTLGFQPPLKQWVFI